MRPPSSCFGTEPRLGAREAPGTRPVQPEDEDVYDIRSSLVNDLVMYGDIIEALRDHVELATNLGDHASAEIIREILVQVEEDAHHIEDYLKDDTLVQQ